MSVLKWAVLFCFSCFFVCLSLHSPDALYSKRRPNAFKPIIIMSWYQIRLLLVQFCICYLLFFHHENSEHLNYSAFSSSHDDNTVAPFNRKTHIYTCFYTLWIICMCVQFIFGSSKPKCTMRFILFCVQYIRWQQDETNKYRVHIYIICVQ